MRYLGIDFGDKRTGLAVGDDLTCIASPLNVIYAGNQEQCISQIGEVIDQHAPDALVVGLPLNMDESEGPAAAKIRALAGRLAEQFDMVVHLVDERLSSEAANDKMSRTGLTRGQKKARRDALAAAAILQDFLDEKPE